MCEDAGSARRSIPGRGRTYRQILVQEYTFSPDGATFQREVQRLNLPPISHLRLTILPDKNGSGRAKLNSLRLFASESRSDT